MENCTINIQKICDYLQKDVMCFVEIFISFLPLSKGSYHNSLSFIGKQSYKNEVDHDKKANYFPPLLILLIRRM